MKNITLVLCVSFIISACGGGSGGSSSAVESAGASDTNNSTANGTATSATAAAQSSAAVAVAAPSAAVAAAAAPSASAAVANRTNLIGGWKVDGSTDQCFERISFSNNGLFVAISGESFQGGTYELSGNGDRKELDITIIEDNGLVDCDGITEDLSQTVFPTLYVTFGGNNVKWFEQPTGGAALESFTFDASPSFERKDEVGLRIDNAEISPSPATIGAATQFMAVVDYTVSDPAGAVFDIGFNDTFMDHESITLLPNPITVASGQGRVTLFGDKTVPDWGEDADFYAIVTISRNTSSGTDRSEVFAKLPVLIKVE